MAPQEKVKQLIDINSDMQTKGNYRTKYERDPPLHPSICSWHKKFMEMGSEWTDGRGSV